jgi:hypothetical protein
MDNLSKAQVLDSLSLGKECTRLKEATKNKVEYCGNELKLLTIDELEFIKTINDIYDKRKQIAEINDDEYSESE